MKYKRFLLCVILAAFVLLCAGCNLNERDSLFALPELSGRYRYLQKELDKILAEGASYAVAGTGTMRSSVQLADLNGDGKEEAIGLFLSKDGVPEVHVFRMESQSCTWLGKLTGVGIGIREIRFFSRGTQGQRALAVSWAYENEARYYGMTVAGVGGNELFTMLDLQYSACLPKDLDKDGVEELTFVRPVKGNEALSACVYQLEGASYRVLTQASLCAEAQSVLKLRYDSVVKDAATLVVDSTAKDGGFVTDVLTFDGEIMDNLTRDPISGSGAAYWRKVAVPAYDINGDGLLELPAAAFADAEGDGKKRILWKSLQVGGAKTVAMAYHNVEERWALLWPEAWPAEISAGVHMEYSHQENTSETVFYVWDADVENQQLRKRVLLTIWAFQGEERARNRARHYAVKPLNEDGEILYGYTLPQEEAVDGYSLTDEMVKQLFCQMNGSLEGGNE